MLILPNNLKCLAKFADQKESGARWAVTGINVELLPDNRYAVAATDTKTLLLVEGTGVVDPEEYPKHGALQTAIDTGTKALIQSKTWESVFADAAKHTSKSSYRSALKGVAITIDPGEEAKGKPNDEDHFPGRAPSAVLGWTNLDVSASPVTRLVEGRFPPYRDIISKSRPLVRMNFDPAYMARLAKALTDLAPLTDKSTCRAEFEFRGEGKPLIVRMENHDTNQKATAIIMPLAGSDGDSLEGWSHCEGLLDDTYWSAEAKRFKQEAESSAKIADVRDDLLRAAQAEIKTLKAKLEGDAIVYLEGVDDVQKHIASIMKKYQSGDDEGIILRLRDTIKDLEQELAILKALGTVEHPPTGTEELSTDDEEAAVDVGDDDEDEDDSEVEDVVEAEHDTDLEVVAESTDTDKTVTASDDPFDVFAASLGL